MKKRCMILMLFVLLLLLSLNGCTYPWVKKYPLPYGVWKSEDPELLLDFNPADNTKDRGTGQYVIDGETMEIYTFRHPGSREFQIIDFNAYHTRGESEIEYFYGTFKQDGDKLYCTLRADYQKRTGYEEIVFEKIEDYPLPEDE